MMLTTTVVVQWSISAAYIITMISLLIAQAPDRFYCGSPSRARAWSTLNFKVPHYNNH